MPRVQMGIWDFEISWEDLEREGATWTPPVYRCAGKTKSGERCKRLVFSYEGQRCCHWHSEQEPTLSKSHGVDQSSRGSQVDSVVAKRPGGEP